MSYDLPEDTLPLCVSLCNSYSVTLPTDDVALSVAEGVSSPLVGVTATTGLPL